MNISWSDLNHVRAAGDYPFRDGIITVTFAEVAAWEKNPGAQFQLMRKYPIQDEFRYVLGKQVEKATPPAGEEPIYQSSNGDCWALALDPATGARAVMHRPNPESGGRVSYIAIDKFLSEAANGPEHQALRRRLETSPPVATILVAYDIHPAKGQAYEDLVKAIQSLGTWWHHLETVWIVRSGLTAGEIRDKLKPHIGIDDQLLVIDISGDTAGWAGVNDIGSKWLNDNI